MMLVFNASRHALVQAFVCMHSDPTVILRRYCYLDIDLEDLLLAENTDLIVMRDRIDQEISQRGREKQEAFLVQTC